MVEIAESDGEEFTDGECMDMVIDTLYELGARTKQKTNPNQLCIMCGGDDNHGTHCQR